MSERMDQSHETDDNREQMENQTFTDEIQYDRRKSILDEVKFTPAWYKQHHRREALLKGKRR